MSDAAATRSTQVAIVGAGFAGLSAALDLTERGIDCVVLEARDRVGGRVLNHDIGDGKVVEVGGQWVGPTQHALLGMAARMGVETYPTHLEGDNVIEYRGAVSRYTGTIPRINPTVLLQVEWFRRRMNAMAAQVPLEAPWAARHAKKWDAITFDEWLRRNAPSRSARMLGRLVIRSVFGTEPEDVSLLHVLFYVHSAGGFDALVDTRRRRAGLALRRRLAARRHPHGRGAGRARGAGARRFARIEDSGTGSPHRCRRGRGRGRARDRRRLPHARGADRLGARPFRHGAIR